jgi:hypothetical protein
MSATHNCILRIPGTLTSSVCAARILYILRRRARTDPIGRSPNTKTS